MLPSAAGGVVRTASSSALYAARQVPRAHLRDVRNRLFIHLRLVCVQPLARGERLFERALDFPVREPPELEDAAAGDDCGVMLA